MTLFQARSALGVSADDRRPRANDPIVAPEQTISTMTAMICAPPLREKWPLWWKLSLAAALLLVVILVIAIVWLFYAGVGVWGIAWPVVWGFAIINYVWWIAIASGGTFISALFYLAEVEWRNALNRIAETITIFAAACAAIYPVLHLGRPWLFYWLFPYPNVMTVWPQFRSPLLWDFVAILTYVVSSILFWYFGLVPDLATMRDKADAPHKRRFYGVLALGFRGSENAWRYYRVGYGLLAALMAPLVISVHSIVGLDFAGAATVGWHSTQFPPFFVFGALLSGFAAVMLLAIPVRRLLGLEAFITGRHFDILGKLLLTSSLCVGYAYLMEAFTTFYGPDPAEKRLFINKIAGELSPIYWATILFNVLTPQLMWWRRVRLNEILVVLISLAVIAGMWCERYVIVVMSLRRTHLPSAWGGYTPTIWDWLTLFGTVGLFIAGLLIAIRLLPAVSMFEMREVILRNARRDR
ncbi:polysulfide reductase NrfD [Methylocystis sp. L43]|jgi:Ni/Fe-hydrogenase subunit HybB-like protein|uniref:NrfD/PsrC family molybdoenzyme membrane anchor subunit n=1 Tax=unclassified Methylocystis TaxID=2625913 RepID=UPI0018C31748|nr:MULTISPECIES: NrfD/PsrC family molybdoenzyme membrane anchor subunit [unclassified Methylocystis]MBG0797804.1 polysulfide reductase NrfD [Methylocystis sp. L43]MBG0806038.1 polysulfide reductase NrfD [Methylocystis sp. H15]